DEYLPVLLEILLADQRELSDENDLVPFSALLTLAMLVDVGLAGGDRQIDHRHAGGRVANLRVLPKMSDDHSLIERHGFYLLLRPMPGVVASTRSSDFSTSKYPPPMWAPPDHPGVLLIRPNGTIGIHIKWFTDNPRIREYP